MEENMWYEILDGLDWDAVDRDVRESLEEDRIFDELHEYFDDDSFDYKRSYLRKFMRTYPKITDRNIIDAATEQMLESHEGGVELDASDALRFAEHKKIPSEKELLKMLTDAGINDGNIDAILDKMLSPDFEDDGRRGSVKNPAAKKKADWLTRFAYVLGRNRDVLILGLPTFTPTEDWVQAKLAFFSEELNGGENYALDQMMKYADRSFLTHQHGVAVACFQVCNAWDDFR